MVWSDDTIQTSIELRYACGKNGYEHLRKIGYPLPAYRTLCNRMKEAPLKSGIQDDFINFISKKTSSLNDSDCILMLDEVQIRKCVMFDKGLNSFIGYISQEFILKEKPNKDNLASHVLVVMARGISVRWKQIIAYCFTGDSVSGEKLWQLMKEIIVKLGEKNVCVRAVVSDMGASNQAMWSSAGICAGRSQIQNSIPHPFFADCRVYFLADPPHLLKNIRNCLLTNKVILPPDVVASNGLPFDTVSVEPIQQLITLQQSTSLKLAPKLTAAHIVPGTYEKMKVSTAAQELSHTTASAIRFLVEHGSLDCKSLTTAWFLDFVNKWFDTCNSRFYKSALYAHSTDKIEFLNSVIDLFNRITFAGKRSGWEAYSNGCFVNCQILAWIAWMFGCKGVI